MESGPDFTWHTHLEFVDSFSGTIRKIDLGDRKNIQFYGILMIYILSFNEVYCLFWLDSTLLSPFVCWLYWTTVWLQVDNGKRIFLLVFDRRPYNNFICFWYDVETRYNSKFFMVVLEVRRVNYDKVFRVILFLFTWWWHFLSADGKFLLLVLFMEISFWLFVLIDLVIQERTLIFWMEENFSIITNF